jgi:hypothetical protein
MCEHFHESTSRYDPDARRLTLLLVCPGCGIETVVETLEYGPHFVPCAIPDRERSRSPHVAAGESLPLAA